MPVSWTDPYGRGLTWADMVAHAPVANYRVDPRLYADKGREQAAQAIQAIVGQVGQYMSQRRNDQIANQLLAAQKAPDFLQGQGQQGLSAYNQLAANQSESTKEYYDQAYKQAQIEHLGRLGYDTGGGTSGVPRYPVTLPDGSTVMVTGNEAAKRSFGTGNAGVTRAQKEMSNFGLSPNDLSNLDVAKSDVVTNKAGDVTDYTIATKDGRIATVPATKWQAWTNILKSGGFTQPTGTTTSAGRNTNQADIDQAAAAIKPNLPTPDYSQSIPTQATQQDKFVVGKKYKDANGNVATYMGNGQWQ